MTGTLEMAALVLEVSQAIGKVEDWRRVGFPNGDVDARAFDGHADGWRFVIVDFDIEEQGYPKGTRGQDGAATHRERKIVIHLTRPQAERAFTLALTRCGAEHEGVSVKMCDVVDQGSAIPDSEDEEHD